MLFSKNSPQFLLHFLIHIAILTLHLCTKFELIPTEIWPFLKSIKFLEKSKDYGFFQKWL